MSLCVRNPTIWVQTRSDTNRAVQSQKMVRGLKFCIYVEEGLYYPCSENKGADQLHGYREADLRLCFRPSNLMVFLCSGSFKTFNHCLLTVVIYSKANTIILTKVKNLFIPSHVTWYKVLWWCLPSLTIGQGWVEVCQFVKLLF